jgi:hypothetical protein
LSRARSAGHSARSTTVLPEALPQPLPLPPSDYISLATAYKDLNAPLGAVGVSSLVAANQAITSGNSAYKSYLKAMRKFTSGRDALATDMKTVLNSSVSGLPPAPAHPAAAAGRRLTQQALQLIGAARHMVAK